VSFGKKPQRTPSSIGTVTVTLVDPNGENTERNISASVEILDQNGRVMDAWYGNLHEHLTPQRRTSLSTFLDDLRAKAAAEFLP
jgi:hypothetical protein